MWSGGCAPSSLMTWRAGLLDIIINALRPHPPRSLSSRCGVRRLYFSLQIGRVYLSRWIFFCCCSWLMDSDFWCKPMAVSGWLIRLSDRALDLLDYSFATVFHHECSSFSDSAGISWSLIVSPSHQCSSIVPTYLPHHCLGSLSYQWVNDNTEAIN